MAIKLTNLIFLMYDRGQVSLVDKKPDDLLIDLVSGTWINQSDAISTLYSHHRSAYRIGHEMRQAFPSYMREGIVGVYDKTKFEHLRMMLHHSRTICDHLRQGFDVD